MKTNLPKGLGGLCATLLFVVSFHTEAAGCDVSDVTADGLNAIDCNLVQGNDTVGGDYTSWSVNIEVAGGASDWMEYQKFDSDTQNLEQTLDLGLVVTGTPGSSGTWAVDTVYSEFLVVLKAGMEYIWYQFGEGDGAIAGTWDTASLTDKDLSHMTLYIKEGGGSPPAVIPVPAAVWLFGSALVGLVGVGRRKKA